MAQSLVPLPPFLSQDTAASAASLDLENLRVGDTRGRNLPTTYPADRDAWWTPVSLSWFAAGEPARPGCFAFFNMEDAVRRRCCSFQTVSARIMAHQASASKL